jgi:hypothetical protein|tara:strand:- start:224 stop:505 length:282 start_codon:yes stop_codon:yes gene_type:complete
MNEVFVLIAEVGFPIAISLIGGFFVFLSIKFILASVVGDVDAIHNIVSNLDNRVKTMNHDMVRIDCTMCSVVGLRPDLERISRADGKEDARRD